MLNEVKFRHYKKIVDFHHESGWVDPVFIVNAEHYLTSYIEIDLQSFHHVSSPPGYELRSILNGDRYRLMYRVLKGKKGGVI